MAGRYSKMQMPKNEKKAEMSDEDLLAMGDEMFAEDEEDMVAEEEAGMSPLADFSDEELLAEARKRGLMDAAEAEEEMVAEEEMMA